MKDKEDITNDLMLLETKLLNPLHSLWADLTFFKDMVKDVTISTALDGYVKQLARDYKTYNAIKNKILNDLPIDKS